MKSLELDCGNNKSTFIKVVLVGLLFPLILYHGISEFSSFRTRKLMIGNPHTVEIVQGATSATNEFEKQNKNNDTCVKRILFASSWYPVLGSKFPYFEEAAQVCPKCTFTQDLNLLSNSHAVVLHGSTMTNTPSLNRSFQEQIWVWMYDEPPVKEPQNLGKLQSYQNFFNWTMTLRKDSDVPWSYGLFVKKNETPMPSFNARWAFISSDITKTNDIYDESLLRVPAIEELKNKKLVAWISSNCGGTSARGIVVNELRKFGIPVDHYGLCGNLSCGNEASYRVTNRITGNAGIDCRLNISKNYKFFLSFENSLCEDYVTEKYFDTLLTSMVPIVYGLANYSEFAPPKSFIDVADFGNIEALANYIKFLDKNTTEYLKYFEWRKDYWVRNNHFVITYCALCDKLWNPGPPKYYKDPRGWYNNASDYKISGRSSACINSNEFVFRNITHMI